MNVEGLTAITLEQGMARYEQEIQNALANLQREGFYLPNAPSYVYQGINTFYRGELPSDITSLTDQQLGWYLSMLSTWGQYCHTKFAEADVNRSGLTEELDFLEAKLTSSLIGEKKGNKTLTGPQVKAIIVSDARYVDLKARLLYWEALYRMMKAATEAAESNWWTISRRITQKGQELERDNRTPPTSATRTGPLFGRR